MTQWTEDIISAEIAGTLDGLLCERVRRSPDSVAYRSYDAARKLWTESTWNDVGRVTAHWQAALAAEELLPGERVALQLRNSKEWVYFDQAALACALVVVPLYTDDRPENVAYILRDSAARVLLLQDLTGWERLAPLLRDYEVLKRVLILNAPESMPEASSGDSGAFRAGVAARGVPCPGAAPGRPACAGLHRLHLRHDRSPQGRHAQSL
jgi:long-chain acyl-CoA synthetase